jgi:methylase of polypeptide subunit release factors
MNNYCDINYLPASFRHDISVLKNAAASGFPDGGSLETLIHAVLFNTGLELFKKESYSITRMQELVSTWDILSNGDIAGYIYQLIVPTKEKKMRGQFFTSEEIVKYIVDRSFDTAPSLKDLRIIDPACGSGQFLLAAFRRLLSLYQTEGIPDHEAVYHIVTRNLYGSDIDPIAVSIARYNLSRLSGVPTDRINHICCFNFLTTDSLFDSFSLNTRQFDAVIGNPPWGSSFNASEKKYFRKIFESAKSGVNSFTLFMEKSLDLLKENGRISFLIPEAYLNIKAHSRSRLLFLNSTRIEEINICGEQFKNVFAPSITISARKCSSETLRAGHSVRITTKQNDGEQTTRFIPQKNYYGTYQNIFNIHYTPKAASVIDTIRSGSDLYLENNATFFLGIVTGDNDMHLSSTCTDSHPHPIVIGKDISPFQINFSGHYFNYQPKELQQSAPQQYYRTENKILYKFIGKKLTFAMDYDGMYSLNNVNGFIPEIDSCSPEYLTALFNSSVMQYYYDNTFFTVKVLRGNLEKLPIKTASDRDMKKISSLAHALAQSPSAEETARARATIDDMFFSIYNIRDRDAYRMIEEGQGRLF